MAAVALMQPTLSFVDVSVSSLLLVLDESSCGPGRPNDPTIADESASHRSLVLLHLLLLLSCGGQRFLTPSPISPLLAVQGNNKTQYESWDFPAMQIWGLRCVPPWACLCQWEKFVGSKYPTTPASKRTQRTCSLLPHERKKRRQQSSR